MGYHGYVTVPYMETYIPGHNGKAPPLNILSFAAADWVPRSADHYGYGHDGNCVDISKYGPVLNNESTTEI